MKTYKIMRRFYKFKYFLSFLGIILVSSCSFKYRDNPIKISPGARLPEFNVTLTEGITISNSDLSDKTALIVFFNTNCKDCQTELPVINELYQKHRDKCVFLAISRAETKESVSDFWKKYNLQLSVSPQNDSRIYKLFVELGIPHIIISKNGVVQTVFNSYLNGVQPTSVELEEAILS